MQGISLLSATSLAASMANSRYSPELGMVYFGPDKIAASDGILVFEAFTHDLAPMPTEPCSLAKAPLQSWLNSGAESLEVEWAPSAEGPSVFTAHHGPGRKSTKAKLFHGRHATPTAFQIPEMPEGSAPWAYNMSCADLQKVISYVLSLSGTDSSMPWSNGITISFSEDGISVYSTNDATMVVGEVRGVVSNGLENKSVLVPPDFLKFVAEAIAAVPSNSPEDGAELILGDGYLVFCRRNSPLRVYTPLEFGTPMPKFFEDNFDHYKDVPMVEADEEFLSALKSHSQYEGSDGTTRFLLSPNKLLLRTQTPEVFVETEVVFPGSLDEMAFTSSARRLARMLRNMDNVGFHEDGTCRMDKAGYKITLLASAIDSEPDAFPDEA